MQVLRHTGSITRFVLVWFVLAVGAAIVSPIVKPQASTLICSSAGLIKVLVQNDDGSSSEATARLLDCPLCTSPYAPPPAAGPGAEPARPLGHVLRTAPVARPTARTAALPPARGPPAFS